MFRFPAIIRSTGLLSLALLFPFAALAQTSQPQQEAALTAPAGLQEAFSEFTAATAASDPADSICQRQAAGSNVASPPNLYSTNGVLTVNFTFKTAVDLQGLTRYCYIYVSSDGTTSYEAPTLRVNPGDQLVINFTNGLSASAANTQSSSMPGMVMKADASAATSDCSATSVSSTSTNLHFHGLNVSPACHQDEVIHTIIQPQQEFTYTVQIPANEPSGLYWYHPHPHGFSQPQVLGGATGVIVIQGIQNFNPAVAGLPERVLVIRDQALSAAEKKISGNQPGNDLSLNYVPVTYPNYVPGVIATPVKTKEFWRVANTSANSLIDLQIVDNGAAQTVQVVAVDGVPVTDGSGNPTTTPETSIVLAPGARVEFIYTTPNQGDTAQLVTLTWNNGSQGDSDPGRPLANIVASSSTSDTGLATTSISRTTLIPEVTQSLPAQRFKALTASQTATVQRTLYFSIKSDFSQFYITVAGQTPTAFNMDAPPSIVVRSGTVEQWTIQNQSKMDHAFHIHQIHFRTLAINGTPVTDYTERDTIDVPHWSGNASDPYPSVTLLMDFTDPDIVGTFVYHCHILSHEDLGMMAAIQVLPPLVASTTAISSSANPSTYGQSITFTATVTGSSGVTPTGTVQFFNYGYSLGTATLVNGVATLTATGFSLNAHPITATYSGDTTYAGSSAATYTQTVKGPSAAAISSSANPSTYGQPITFTATVTSSAPGTPTGTVQFFNFGYSLGTATLSNGKASLTATGFSVNAHPITATYSGDGTFFSSSAPTFTQTVKATTTTTISSNANPSTYGQPIVFTATVTSAAPGTPTGTVQFYNFGYLLGTANVVNGKASFTATGFSKNAHPITATYSGDSNFFSSSAPRFTQTVQ